MKTLMILFAIILCALFACKEDESLTLVPMIVANKTQSDRGLSCYYTLSPMYYIYQIKKNKVSLPCETASQGDTIHIDIKLLN